MEKESDKNKEIEMSRKDIGEEEQLSDGYFSIDVQTFKKLFNAYEQRHTDEELVFMQTLGGDKGIIKSLRTNIESGISIDEEELARRVKNFGPNKLEMEELKHCCWHVMEALKDMMLQILIVAAIIQTVLGGTISAEPEKDWIDGLSIIIAVVVVVSVGSITNYQKEKSFKELNDTNDEMTKYVIVRNGHSKEVVSDDILVGDIVNIGVGVIIPADGIMLTGQVKIDESALTGESKLLVKESMESCFNKKEDFLKKGKPIENKNSIPSPLVFAGTNTDLGEGKMVVVAVGKYSAKGRIREEMKMNQEAEDSKTPLEEKLDTLAEQIGYFGLISAAVTLVALFIQFGVTYPGKQNTFIIANQTSVFLNSFSKNYPEILASQTIKNIINKTTTDPATEIAKVILDIFLLCVAIIVVAIPEGLPLAVTLALAFSIAKMTKENNLVRKMQACETMGGASYICSDKTGTLTKNMMCVVSVFDGKKVIEMEDVTKDKEVKADPTNYFPTEYYKLFRFSILLNIQATINEGDVVAKANKSDEGYIDLFHIFGEGIYNFRKKYLGSEPRAIAFNSDRKRMNCYVKSSEFPTGYRMFIKGASDVLLMNFASYYLDPATMEKKILSDLDKTNFEGIIKQFGNKTLRTMVIGYKDITEQEYENFNDCDEKDIIIVCIVGIRDILRPNVPEAVLKCHTAGIQVVMVTGDFKNTAVAIARQCNIIGPGDNLDSINVAMTGEEFYNRIKGIDCITCDKKVELCNCPKTPFQAKKRNMDEDKIRKDRISDEAAFRKIAAELRVIARCRPLDKYALVLGLRKMNHVVAVTGDGTNDALALSKADVGFAMGIQGTDIAKEASDIILLDDNFASIVTAVLWGRNIYDNIRKFIQFQLSVNLCACFLVFITACIGNETPLKPIQMLWVNLIMDSLGSLALATEPPHENLLQRLPYKRKEGIINSKMWKHIMIQALLQLGMLLFLYLDAPNFIMEDDPVRISESQIIYKCFGTLPGNLPYTDDSGIHYYIIHGSSSMWSSDVIFNPAYSKLECGNYAEKSDMLVAYLAYTSANGGTSHMTIIFNIFVFYTLFNQINARVIDDNFNILYRIHKNWMFVLVTLIEMGLQVLLIEFGSNAFKVASRGLTGQQWGICIGFAAFTFPVSAFIKLLPLEGFIDKLLNCFGSNKVASSDEDEKDDEVNKSHNNPNVALSVRDKESEIKKEGSSKKKGGIVNAIVRSRSSKHSIQPIELDMRKNKQN